MAAKKRRRKLLKRSAVRLDQGGPHPIYQFSLRGDELLQIADISRLDRGEDGKLLGYQRPGVKKHIKEIADYIGGENVIFPNSIIVALNSTVRFKKSRGPRTNEGPGINGTLEIEIPEDNQKKPGWIVDGQQRALAVSQSSRPDLPIPVNAFVTDDVEIQRDQFLRVNSAKPLPRGLVTELLPEVSTSLPPRLAARRVPSSICGLLNSEKTSPFCGLIKRASTSGRAKKGAIIADNSIINMIQESLGSPSGCLFPYRNIATGETDSDSILLLLTTYWTAVKRTFPDAWGLPPSKSRLLHGVGVRSMGRLMDKIMPSIPLGKRGAVKAVEKELKTIAPIFCWTQGTWQDLNTPWDGLQNVPRHINALSNLLIRAYVQIHTPSYRSRSANA